MKTILVPTDFSANAANAITYAVQLANQVKGKLIFVHALTSQILGLPEEDVTIDPEQLLKASYLEELNKLAKTLQLENGFRFEVETVCCNGPLYQCVTTVAAEKKVDLIVMGTRGASTFLQKLVGTNTLSVMQEAQCPVLAIPAKATFKGFKTLAYASDFEKEETSFLRQLFALAQPFNAEVQIVNVKNEEQLDLVADEQIIKQIAREFPAQAYSISQVKQSKVVEGIKTFTKKNNVDVVAVAIEKRTFWEDLFHYSVSSQLAFESTLPLLALPQTNEKPNPKSASGVNKELQLS
ncbi:MAG: universal stress protein [Rufibacter sp.]